MLGKREFYVTAFSLALTDLKLDLLGTSVLLLYETWAKSRRWIVSLLCLVTDFELGLLIMCWSFLPIADSAAYIHPPLPPLSLDPRCAECFTGPRMPYSTVRTALLYQREGSPVFT